MNLKPPYPVRHPPLARQVEELIALRIQEGAYPASSQLPPESELAAEMNISRATLRSALANLAMQGLVVRRHGAGTFVSGLPKISNPLDRAIDFQHLIKDFCCTPKVEFVHTVVEACPAGTAKGLQIGIGDMALVAHKLFLADGEPMIYCINTFSPMVIPLGLAQEILRQPQITEPISDFFENRCNQTIKHQVARLHAALARDCQFHGSFQIDPLSAVLVIDETAYNLEGSPLFHTLEYHPENRMSFEIYRRWEHR